MRALSHQIVTRRYFDDIVHKNIHLSNTKHTILNEITHSEHDVYERIEKIFSCIRENIVIIWTGSGAKDVQFFVFESVRHEIFEINFISSFLFERDRWILHLLFGKVTSILIV